MLARTMPEVHKFFETQCNGRVWQLLKQVKRRLSADQIADTEDKKTFDGDLAAGD